MPTAFLDKGDRTLHIAQAAFRNTDIKGWRSREVEGILGDCRSELGQTLETLKRTQSLPPNRNISDKALRRKSEEIARDHLIALARQKSGSKIIERVDISEAEWLINPSPTEAHVSKRRAYLAVLMEQVLGAESLEEDGGMMVRSSDIDFITNYLNGDGIFQILQENGIGMGHEDIETYFTDAKRGSILKRAKDPSRFTKTFAENLIELEGNEVIMQAFGENSIELSDDECNAFFSDSGRQYLAFNSADIRGVLRRAAKHVAETLTNAEILKALEENGVTMTDFDLARKLPLDQRVKIASKCTANPMRMVVRLLSEKANRKKGSEPASGPRATEALDDLQEAG